jgi:hypothetical protein
MLNDPELSKILGPCNPCITGNAFNISECSRFGGCRMFTCNDREDRDDDEIIVPERSWFTGKCMSCDLIISKYCYATRRPTIDGGWSGCYCSNICMLANIELPSEVEVTQLMMEQFKDITIYDR